MDSSGFIKNNIGTGVSVPEKKDIYDGVVSYISEMACTVEGVKRVNSTKNARSKLKLDAINFNKELNDGQRVYEAGITETEEYGSRHPGIRVVDVFMK